MRKMIRRLPDLYRCFLYRRPTSRKRAAVALLRALGAHGPARAAPDGAERIASQSFGGSFPRPANSPAGPARLQAARRSSTVYGNSLRRHDSAVPDMEIHR